MLTRTAHMRVALCRYARYTAIRSQRMTTGAGQSRTSLLPKVLGMGVAATGLLYVTLQTCEPAEELFYTNIAMPALRRLDPETAHVIAIKLAALGLAPRERKPDDPVLRTAVWGRTLTNPLGVAAGYDKHAEAIDATFGFGAGFLEIGSVTPVPQPGNPKPRMFRLVEDEAVINRYGFNSEGLDAVRSRLEARMSAGKDQAARQEGRLLGVNVGKNKVSTALADDFVKGIEELGPFADFIVVNISSPNTPGLRALQSKDQLQQLVRATQSARDQLVMKDGRAMPPLLIKIAPDLTEEDKRDIAAVAMETKIDGLIVSNTTIERPDTLQSQHKGETGGLSGTPLFRMSTNVLRDMYRLTNGKVVLIGTGGVGSGADAYEKIKEGASLVEIYSALSYGGPHLVGRIKRDLAALLKADGYTCVADAVGAEHKRK